MEGPGGPVARSSSRMILEGRLVKPSAEAMGGLGLPVLKHPPEMRVTPCGSLEVDSGS